MAATTNVSVRSLHLLLASYLGWILIEEAVVVPLFVIQKVAVAGCLLLTDLPAVIALTLLRKGRVRAAVTVFLSSMWCATAAYSVLRGGVGTEGTSLTVLVVLNIACLLGRAPAIGFGTATLLPSFTETVLQHIGHPIPAYFPGAPLAVWAVEVSACPRCRA